MSFLRPLPHAALQPVPRLLQFIAFRHMFYPLEESPMSPVESSLQPSLQHRRQVHPQCYVPRSDIHLASTGPLTSLSRMPEPCSSSLMSSLEPLALSPSLPRLVWWSSQILSEVRILILRSPRCLHQFRCHGTHPRHLHYFARSHENPDSFPTW